MSFPGGGLPRAGFPSRHPGPDDLAAHAIGGLDRREERRVTRHAGRCERCRTELARLAPAVAVLAESVEQHQPPPELRERLLADVRAEAVAEREGTLRRSRQDGLRGFLLRPAAGLAAVAVLGAAVAGYLVAGDDDEAETLSVTSAMGGAEGSLELTGDGATLEMTGMPQLEKGAVYQVWISEEERSGTEPAQATSIRPSATFVPAGDGSATAAVPEALDGPGEVMVTEEPRPGRSTPSGPPLLTVRVD